MATCDQILEMFSPYSTLHIIIVIDSSAVKRSIDIYYYKNFCECSFSAKLNSVVAALLCLSLSSPSVSVTKELIKTWGK